jgi:branched-chain amino acid aminotransferase
VDFDWDWIPEEEGTSCTSAHSFLQPTRIWGVRPSNTIHLCDHSGPVGAYYKEGINPVKIL